MVFNRDRAFAMTKESKKGQEPEQMNRYTANVTEKAEERRGRGISIPEGIRAVKGRIIYGKEYTDTRNAARESVRRQSLAEGYGGKHSTPA